MYYKMNSLVTSDPTSSTEYNDHSPIKEDSRNGEVTVADVAGVVTNLNKKIHLLRQEILDLRDSGTISKTRTSVIEKSGPSRLLSEGERPERNLGRNLINKIPSLSIFEKKPWTNELNESKNSNSESSIRNSYHERTGTSDNNLPLTFETQSGNRLVYVVGAGVRSRTASPFNNKSKECQSNEQRQVGEPACPIKQKYANLAHRGDENFITRSMKNDQRKKKYRGEKTPNNGNDDTEYSDETIHTSSESCSSGDDIPYLFQKPGVGQHRCRCRNKFVHIEPEMSNKCSNAKCYGMRVRKRISRGVQTLPKRKLLYRIKRKFVNFFRFTRRSRKNRGKCKEKCSLNRISETPAKKQSVEVIYKPPRNCGRNDNILHTSSKYATSDKNDKKNTEKPAQVNGDNSLNKNYNRKYDFSIDGTNIEIIRREKSGSGDKMAKISQKSTVPSRTDSGKQRTNSGRQRRAKSKQKVVKAIEVNERNLISPDEERTDQINEGKSNKSNRRGNVNKKNNATDGKIDEPIISDIEGSTTEKITVCSQGNTNPGAFKSFTKTLRKSFTPRRAPMEKSLEDQKRHDNATDRNEHIGKQLEARRNDITDVKKCLDVCITDLNDIILNLSKVSQQISAPGGPAGEGVPPESRNCSPPGRSRLR